MAADEKTEDAKTATAFIHLVSAGLKFGPP